LLVLALLKLYSPLKETSNPVSASALFGRKKTKKPEKKIIKDRIKFIFFILLF